MGTLKKNRISIKKLKPFRTITLLNMVGKGSGAYISCEIDEKIGKWNGYKIIISDCNQKTELYGALRTIENRRNALHKITTLLNNLTEKKKHMLEQFKHKNLKV